MMMHEMKCQTEIEKEHIKADAGLHQTRMTLDRADETRNAKEAEKVVGQKVKEGRDESAKEIAAIKTVQDKIISRVDSFGKEFESAITRLSDEIKKPKKVVIERDGTGKITGATQQHTGDQQ